MNVTPPRVTGTVCGEFLGSGLISYRCSRALGHTQVPADDPEPHYAVEVKRSVISWNAWNERQQNPPQTVEVEEPFEATAKGVVPEDEHFHEMIPCPNWGQGGAPHHLLAKFSGAQCPCGWRMPTIEEVANMEKTAAVLMDLGPVNPAWDGETFHNLPSPPESSDQVGFINLIPTILQDPITEEDQRSEPTKQREGDQRLPEGGQECVQDLVIAEMQESKRVGTERYGSPLMTFNGRRSIQDVAEEVRDLHVYLTQVKRESEAARETLVEVVAETLGSESAAEAAVDAVMGWVAGRLMKGEISDEVLESVVLDTLHAGVHNEATYGEIATLVVQALRRELAGG